MENDIDLDPDYQRGSSLVLLTSACFLNRALDVVWTEAAQSKIIESWMKRFHVPEILFR